MAGKGEGEKHNINSGYSHEDDSCALCGSKLDTDKGEASALHATIISQKYSSRKSHGTEQDKTYEVKNDTSVQKGCKEIMNGDVPLDPGGGTCGCTGVGGSCNKTVKNSLKDQSLKSVQTMERYLCYGCRVTVRDLVSKTFQNNLLFFLNISHLTQLVTSSDLNTTVK